MYLLLIWFRIWCGHVHSVYCVRFGKFSVYCVRLRKKSLFSWMHQLLVLFERAKHMSSAFVDSHCVMYKYISRSHWIAFLVFLSNQMENSMHWALLFVKACGNLKYWNETHKGQFGSQTNIVVSPILLFKQRKLLFRHSFFTLHQTKQNKTCVCEGVEEKNWFNFESKKWDQHFLKRRSA